MRDTFGFVVGAVMTLVCGFCLVWDDFHLMHHEPHKTFTAIFIFLSHSVFWGGVYLPLGLLLGVMCMAIGSARSRPKRN